MILLIIIYCICANGETNFIVLELHPQKTSVQMKNFISSFTFDKIKYVLALNTICGSNLKLFKVIETHRH